MSEINPYEESQTDGLTLPYHDRMPGSAKLALLSLGTVIFEQCGLVSLEIVNGDPIRPIDAAFAVAAIVLLVGLLLRNAKVWLAVRAFAWVGIVLLSVATGHTVGNLQRGHSSLWAIPYLIFQFALVAALYYSLGQPTARQYYRVTRSPSIANTRQPQSPPSADQPTADG